jgi:hypothetical protein
MTNVECELLETNVYERDVDMQDTAKPENDDSHEVVPEVDELISPVI